MSEEIKIHLRSHLLILTAVAQFILGLLGWIWKQDKVNVKEFVSSDIS